MVKYRIFPAVVAALALDPVSCLATDFVGAVAVQGDYAYVGINRSVVVVDVSDPRHPAPVGQTSFWPDNRHWFVEDVNAISVAGDHAYVVYDVGAYSGRKHSMVVIDVSCPTEPRVVASYDCFSGRASGVTVSGHQAYLYHSIGLDVVDISTPTEPARVGRWTTHDSPSRIVRHPGPFVAIAGNHAYVADQKGGLRVLDVSDPTAPEEVGSCPSAYCENVAVFGNLAFVTSGLEIIDIGDPENPKVIDTYHNRRLLASRPARMGVFAVGNYVFFYGCDRAVWREPIPPSDPLPVVDISDPSLPRRLLR